MSQCCRRMKKRCSGSAIKEDTCIMMNLTVKLLKLVTKIKYLPVASCLFCVRLSQTIKCVQFKHPSSREQTNPSSPTAPRSACVSVRKPRWHKWCPFGWTTSPSATSFSATETEMLGCGQPQGWGQWSLGHGWDGVMGRSHLSEHLIQPLQGPVEVNLNPAGCASHVLPVVLGTPSLVGNSTKSVTFRFSLFNWLNCWLCKFP